MKHETVALLYLLFSLLLAVAVHHFFKEPYRAYTSADGRYRSVCISSERSEYEGYPYRVSVRFSIEGNHCFTLFYKSFDRRKHPLGTLDLPSKVVAAGIHCRYGIVQEYNTLLATFPSNLVGKLFSFRRMEYLELPEEVEKRSSLKWD